MKIIHYLFLFAFVNSAIGQDITFEWNKTTGNADQSLGYGCQVDLDGNIYYVGIFNGEFDLSGTLLECAPKHLSGQSDAYLLKVSPEGDMLWWKQFSSYYNMRLTSIAVDQDNHVYVLGDYRVKVEFDNHVIQTNNTDTIYSDNTYLAKFSPDGDLVWAKNTGGQTNAFRGNAITFDQDNNLLITGTSIDLSLYDTSDAITTLDSTIYNITLNDTTWTYYHPKTAFIAKYTSDGEQLWITEAGASPVHIKADYDNNIIITGLFGALGATFGGQNIASLGTNTGFIAQYDADGVFNWVKTFGGTANWNAGYATTVDSSNNIYLTGRLFGSYVEFAGEMISDTEISYGFLSKFHSNGNLAWMNLLGTNTDDQCNSLIPAGYDILLDRNNDLLLIGAMGCPLKLAGSNTWMYPNGNDLMIFKYGLDGTIKNYGHYDGFIHARGGGGFRRNKWGIVCYRPCRISGNG